MLTRMVRESTPAGNRRNKVHPAELTQGNRGGLHLDRCGDEHRQRWWRWVKSVGERNEGTRDSNISGAFCFAESRV